MNVGTYTEPPADQSLKTAVCMCKRQKNRLCNYILSLTINQE